MRSMGVVEVHGDKKKALMLMMRKMKGRVGLDERDGKRMKNSMYCWTDATRSGVEAPQPHSSSRW